MASAGSQRPHQVAAIMNSTRPSTIAAILSSNPLAYLAWIGEKFLEWPQYPCAVDHILANVTLYWLTDSLPRCAYTYRHTFMCGPTPGFPLFFDKPFGYSWFRKELMSAPRKLVEKKGQLVFYRQHDHGGHFAAMERPDDFLIDMEGFMKIIQH
ncbi:Alpha/Beta hydrolase protein [Xylariaceae sp. FL0662B]|nr:Alpha/Beta hydrolase protein [Xylariaceae sp. FL0662B]